MSGQRVLYVVSEPWYFANHRLDHARGLIDDGFDVHVATRRGDRVDEIVEAGCTVHEFDMSRGSATSIVAEARALRRLVSTLRPDVVHAVALKPVALCLTLLPMRRRPGLILGVNGLGISAAEGSRSLAALRAALRTASTRPRVELLFQTEADRNAVLGDRARGVIIAGVGVDLDRFTVAGPPSTPPFRVAYLGRAVRSKGLTDLAAAADDPRVSGAGVEIHAYCTLDPGSPGSLSSGEIAAIDATAALTVHPPTTDAAGVLASSHAAILPSRAGEGVSKFVLESLATGTPVLLSEQSGSGEVIEPGVTGLTFQAANPVEIADALVEMAGWSCHTRTDVGKACRHLAEQRYGLDVIVPQIVELHRRVARDGRS